MSPEPLFLSTSEDKTRFVTKKTRSSSIITMKARIPLVINHLGANGCQEGLDGIPEEEVYNSSSLFQNGKTSPAGSHSPKLTPWNPEENLSSAGRYHACDRRVLLAVCFISAASLVLTLLMLFGIVAPLHCACSGETGIS